MIPYVETHLVDHCNLNCKGCSHFSSLAKPYFTDINEFEKNLSALARVEEVKILRLMGGEPLLHPDWIKFCEVSRRLLPKASIVLVTNGILIAKITEKANELNDLGVTVCRSDYGLKIADFEHLNSTQIHNKGQLYNISLDLSGKQDATDSFINCDLAMNKWYFLKGDRLFTCCIFANIDIFTEHFGETIDYDINDVSIQFPNKSAEEIEKFLSTPHKACRYCNTKHRSHSYGCFDRTKKEISEWTYQ